MEGGREESENRYPFLRSLPPCLSAYIVPVSSSFLPPSIVLKMRVGASFYCRPPAPFQREGGKTSQGADCHESGPKSEKNQF